ncbi:hypothetical protein ABIE62_002945 [Porphyrobacter sp. MBR-155]|jgi:hypothetical protein|uniref:hypothetical protein n=1 Tax=Porphyrobacter sp. MBR-155 TaxID=3156464 RepID=UPI0033918AD6
MTKVLIDSDHHRRIPLSQNVVRNSGFDRLLLNRSITPDRTRLVTADYDHLLADERLTLMGEMIVERNGGSLRTFVGNRAHENGYWPSFKRKRLQHWEGETQRYALLAAECDHAVEWAQSEPCLLKFPIGNEMFEWYADLQVSLFDAPDELWEIKRNERDLADERYRLKLAGVREICRRIGMRFRLVMAEDIVVSRHHRNNLELFASRRFLHISPHHMRCFEAFALNNGPDTTYGELANVLEPQCSARGAAVIQALTVRRRVEIDLRSFLTSCTPVRIH